MIDKIIDWFYYWFEDLDEDQLTQTVDDTIEYIHALEARIEELQEENHQLQRLLNPTVEIDQVKDDLDDFVRSVDEYLQSLDEEKS
jgi:FtsZ-binding cell division protein ZapB